VAAFLVDRYGIGRMAAITAGICLLGALLTAATPNFYAMATGRLLYGIGAETFSIATLAVVALWFPTRYTALAMGLTLAMGAWIAERRPLAHVGARPVRGRLAAAAAARRRDRRDELRGRARLLVVRAAHARRRGQCPAGERRRVPLA